MNKIKGTKIARKQAKAGLIIGAIRTLWEANQPTMTLYEARNTVHGWAALSPSKPAKRELQSVDGLSLWDITGSGTEKVQVEVIKVPAGYTTLYVHVNGVAIFRMRRAASVSLKDRRLKK